MPATFTGSATLTVADTVAAAGSRTTFATAELDVLAEFAARDSSFTLPPVTPGSLDLATAAAGSLSLVAASVGTLTLTPA